MIKGTDDLRKIVVGISAFSKDMQKTARSISRSEMDDLRSDMVARTPIDTGKARSKWSQVMQLSDVMYFELDVPYGFALDEGSKPGNAPWPSVGPRTALYKGHIFSSQVADGEGGITREIFTEERKGRIASTIMDALYKEFINGLGG